MAGNGGRAGTGRTTGGKSAGAHKVKTADDLLTQATRIQITTNRLSRKARTGVASRRLEARGDRAAAAARQRAFELQKPKPLSRTAQLKQERDARRHSREQAVNTARLIRQANSKRH